jgi:hypothetical protein
MELEDESGKKSFRLFNYSVENEKYPNQIRVFKSEKNEIGNMINEEVFAFIKPKGDWLSLKIIFDHNKLFFKIGEEISFIRNEINQFVVDKIWIAGNRNSNLYLPCRVAYFKLFDLIGKDLINELIFYYGGQHYLSYSKSENVSAIGSPSFLK